MKKIKVSHEPIGYLVCARQVVCLDCANIWPEAKLYSYLYRVNIFPYKQTCHKCNKVLVEPQSKAWCELYEKPN